MESIHSMRRAAAKLLASGLFRGRDYYNLRIVAGAGGPFVVPSPTPHIADNADVEYRAMRLRGGAVVFVPR